MQYCWRSRRVWKGRCGRRDGIVSEVGGNVIVGVVGGNVIVGVVGGNGLVGVVDGDAFASSPYGVAIRIYHARFRSA